MAEECALDIAHLLPALKLSAVDVRRAGSLRQIAVVLVLENIPVLAEMPVAAYGFPHLPRLRLSHQFIFLENRDVLKQQSGQGSALVFLAQFCRGLLVPVYLIPVNNIVGGDIRVIKSVVRVHEPEVEFRLSALAFASASATMLFARALASFSI